MINGSTLTYSNVSRTSNDKMDKNQDVEMDQEEEEEVNNVPMKPVVKEQSPWQLDDEMEDSAQAKIREESIKKAVILKRKELKWKLMQASQQQNKAKLQEIGIEVKYHRQKLSKAQDLVAKLRSKYLKVVKAAKISELQLKKAEVQLSSREKFVADEKMQLTKLALDCNNLGNQLYGPSYQLPRIPTTITETKLMFKKPGEAPAAHYIDSKKDLLNKLSPFLRNARTNAIDQNNSDMSNHSKSMTAEAASSSKKRKKIHVTKLSSIYDCKDSILKNLSSIRLTSKFLQRGFKLTDLNYSHNISPHEYICLPDLIGECTDKSCPYQHKSNYIMTDLEKLGDILSYKPSVANFKPDPELSDQENEKLCRIQLKHYAARLIARNSNRSAEALAQGLVKRICSSETDQTLITMTRQLPKRSPPPGETADCSCKQVVATNEDEPTGDATDQAQQKRSSVISTSTSELQFL